MSETSNTPMSREAKFCLRLGLILGYIAGAGQVLIFWWMA